MHVVQAALALLASGAAVLIIAGLVRESVHDKKHLSRSSVGTREQPAAPPLRANPELSESETSAEPDPVAPASRGKRERRKKHSAAGGGDRDARRRRREAKRRERGERSGQRAKEADPGASTEAEDG